MLYEAGNNLPVLDLDDSYSGNISSYFVEDASFFAVEILYSAIRSLKG